MPQQDAPANHQLVCYVDVLLDVQTTETPGASRAWFADDYLDQTRSARYVLRYLKELWSKTASLSHVDIKFELLALVDAKSRTDSLRLAAYVETPSGPAEDFLSEDLYPALRLSFMKALRESADVQTRFNTAVRAGKHPAITVARTTNAVDDIVCENPIVVTAMQQFLFSDVSHKRTRPALTVSGDRGESFEIPPACPMDLSTKPTTSAEKMVSGYLQELNTKKGTVLLYLVNKSGGISLYVKRHQFKQIVDSQLAEQSVDATIEVSSASIAGLSVPMQSTLKEFKPTPVQADMKFEGRKLGALAKIPESLRSRLRGSPKNKRVHRKPGVNFQ